MFVLTTLVYPVALALLCAGAGLLVDRLSGGVLAAMLLPTVGAATLIVVSQLTTYVAAIAPATPYLLAAVAIAGFALGWRRLRTLASLWRTRGWQLALAPLAYVLALAPVLLAGRPTFSSYMALADSAVHMLGADFLIHHGQDYSHLDLRNSYGATIHAYYGTSYPSGADTLLGGSALLLGLPLIWAFQPFTAFMLAIATGPAWVLVRRVGPRGGWAAVATLTVTLPALVYAYELIGSLKEIVALSLILSMGALVVTHTRWLWAGARAAIPFALLIAAGVAALGVAFGVWALAATLVLVVVVVIANLASRAAGARALPGLVAVGAICLLVAGWPTWAHLSGSLHVAQAIASTSNPGNLQAPLRSTQLLGVWLGGDYKLLPVGVALTLTSVLIGMVILLVLLGVGNLVRSGRYVIAGWFALMIVLWLVLSTYATTWADAKTLMLTSPVVVLMAWAGIAALWSSPVRLVAPLLAFLLVAGVVVSDALQYHQSNLAPTARYEELASIDTRFAGRGPTLFTDFDEYALYELRDMGISAPDFASPPPVLASAAAGYGRPVVLDRIAPSALAAYPLIVMRRDPSADRPPAAYRLLWQGSYYQVWGRERGVEPALLHVVPSGSPAAQCAQLGRIAAGARSLTDRFSVPRGSRNARLVVALAPPTVVVPIPRSRFKRPPGWARVRSGIVMRRPGLLPLAFELPHGGVWRLWLKGEIMRELRISIDGLPLGSIGAQLDGNSLVSNTLTPLSTRLSAGTHTLTITRPGASLAPGDGGAAVLSSILLTPAGPAGQLRLQAAPLAQWRSLCGHALQWLELVSNAR